MNTAYMTASERLSSTRKLMLRNHEWFGNLALRLKLTPAEIPTFSTDGIHLYYNPAFLEQLSERELIFVIAHETLHCALGHLWRLNGRDAKLFNKAADYVNRSNAKRLFTGL
jgi:predicted metal-dependent peptidase